MKYYKITNSFERHRGLKYQTGLNVDIVPFNDDPNASCVRGGIYFSDAENIMVFGHHGPWIRKVTIPERARVLKDPEGPTKYRADQVILAERREWYDADVLRELVNEGVDVCAGGNYALCQVARLGRLKAVQFLVENGADVRASADYALRWAAHNGHLEVVRYLVEQGADARAVDDYALRWAARNGHREVVQYLESLSSPMTLLTKSR